MVNVGNSLDLDNDNIIEVNSLYFADPGPSEGIFWTGTAAKIVVSPADGRNLDGALRLVNDRDGIRLEANTFVDGDVAINGDINGVRSLSAVLGTFTTISAENVNADNLSGSEGRINVRGQMVLHDDVHLLDATSFIGTVRAGGLTIAGDGSVNGAFSAQSISAAAGISAGGNIEAGPAALLRAGAAGIWIGDRRVFDGNGNLLARPVYECPAGQLMIGTDNRGVANCVDVSCDANEVFRGLDDAGLAICGPDNTGLAQLPAQECAEGLAIIAIDPDGRTTCGSARAGNQFCDPGEFVVGFDPDGSLICDIVPEDEEEAPDLRGQIVICGSIDLDVETVLALAGVENVEVVEDCTPTDRTQAFLIMRDGPDDYDAGLVRSYVRAGGIAITEYGNSHRIFNDIFETALDRGERRGNCAHEINPPIRLNVRNRFWRANAQVAEHEGPAGCGYQVDHFPEIITLGGWAENQSFLAYKDLGLGRVWINDVDWGEAGNNISRGSRSLLAYMIQTGRRDGDLFEFEGVRENVADSRLLGWYACHTSRYNGEDIALADIKQRCNGDKMMLGCRPVGAPNWTILAQGARAEVFRDTGNENNELNRHNDVDWYFSSAWSLGFVEPGTGVERNRCDLRGDPGRNHRLCWNTDRNRLQPGFRCGARTNLNNVDNWERAFFSNRINAGRGDVFTSCKDALDADNEQSGIYDIFPPGADDSSRVYCDMDTDGGGWTLVASSRNETLNDQQSAYYDDVASLSPGSANAGIWNGLRGFEGNFDIRFACRAELGGADDAMTVDLTFYDTIWYQEWTEGGDGDSCFEEANGQGATQPPPARRNNITDESLAAADQYGAGFLEGEDECGDADDFTVDFDDRGMGGDRDDGTDWGEADGCQKCGEGCLDEGQWFIFVRELPVPEFFEDLEEFEGIRNNVAEQQIDDWCLCHSSRFAQSNISLRDLQDECDGAFVMMGCREVGEDRWAVMAMGEQAEVFTDTGNDNNEVHDHNGVAWYYSEDESMGFAPTGLRVQRQSCDTGAVQEGRRMCWHTSAGSLAGGWRCGGQRGLSGALDWERAMWTRGGNTQCAPVPLCAGNADCADGLGCDAGRCLPPPPDCLVDRNCVGEDEVCQEGQCVEVLPECAEDVDCDRDAGEICFEEQCIIVGPPPDCQNNNECARGLQCIEGNCIEPPPECEVNADCDVEGEVCRNAQCG